MRVVHGADIAIGQMLDLSDAGGWIGTEASYSVGSVLRLEFTHPEDGRRVGVDVVVNRLVALSRSARGSFGAAVEFSSRMLDLDPLETPDGRRIRPCRRPALWIPLEFHIGGDGTRQGSLEDISARGLRIVARRAPTEGARIRVQLLPPDGSDCPRVGLLGVVRWRRLVGAGYAFGVDIEEVGGKEQTEAWAEYVLKRLQFSGEVKATAS